jgi:hypothetical protein
MKLSDTEKRISITIGRGYAQRFIMMNSSSGPLEYVEILEKTVEAMGNSVREAIDYFGLTVDDDRENKICDATVDVFMTEVGMLNRSWSNRSDTFN